MGPTGPSFVQNGPSFADLVRGKKDSGNQGAKTVTVESKGAPYPLHFIGRSIIGYAKNVWALPSIRRSLEIEGLIDFGLSYVGGVTFIITVKDNALAKEVIAQHGSFFDSIFSKFKIWNGEDIPFSRIVTLKCSGVPFRIRDNNLFDNIGGLFGDIIKPSAFSWNEEDNSINTVKVVTSYSHIIDEAVVIKWNDKSIVTWVSEVPEQGFSNLVNESLYGSGDEESDTESESTTVADDMDEYEEGEIRSKDNPLPDSVNMVDAPIAGIDDPRETNEQSPEFQEAPDNQEVRNTNDGVEKMDVHGEDENTVYGSNVHGNNNDFLNNKNTNGGPNVLNPGVELNEPNTRVMNDGPTPVANLGKRNRAELNPPSFGSTQGPSQRIFFSRSQCQSR
ncbi:hypothetical protein Hanom_Chr02g00169421 [Helianthus anomalus]